ncbi:16S rRNA (cytosine(1402)-N(4))-methyltransferase RsmH [Microbacter margulisiae]|uniref:Ribosomal RNA small subunit methyltransferase H n=1 Tax=Microbacter margulisiae TaxID=1350067 RepID=A0A7W5H2A3_9PORP|nr:16S rRNA (cytosine(1402)-N(4))-methyltransferase RsmH [Microbacter margulisiae]MBB3187429.1 16S rRNA (cytosine1402-N4)-methyltransferase [Microbacter margulisiae]
MNAYHVPALLTETIEGLRIHPDGIYVDATFGGGGHAREIMRHLGEKGKLLAFDQDKEAYANRIDDSRFTFIHGNFRFLTNFLRYHHIVQVDGILADLGVSFHHFDTPNRGFSFRFEGELDMRMNPQADLTAAIVINNYSEEQLAFIFSVYGELSNARKLASLIVKHRMQQPVTTIQEFLEIIQPAFRFEREKKEMAKAFQALRIEVNHEMKALQEFLEQTPSVLKSKGRLAIITYHSLEDRMVKNFMRSGNCEGIIHKDFFGRVETPFQVLTGKPIIPSTEEITNNPRSRSAKLRVAEKSGD